MEQSVQSAEASDDQPKADQQKNQQKQMEDDRVQSCAICFENYDIDSHIPCIGLCGHTICSFCRDCMTTSRCPHCNRKEAFAVRTINKQLLDLIRFLNALNNRATIEKKKPSVRGHCKTCHESATKLRVCLDCMRNSGILNAQCKMENVEDLEEVAYKIRNHAMCGDCVLDHGHFTHKTILIPNSMGGFKKFMNQEEGL